MVDHEYDFEDDIIDGDEPVVDTIIEEYIDLIPFIKGDIVCFHGTTYPTGGFVEDRWRNRQFLVKDVALNGWLLLSRPLNAWVRPEDCVLVGEDE